MFPVADAASGKDDADDDDVKDPVRESVNGVAAIDDEVGKDPVEWKGV